MGVINLSALEIHLDYDSIASLNFSATNAIKIVSHINSPIFSSQFELIR